MMKDNLQPAESVSMDLGNPPTPQPIADLVSPVEALAIIAREGLADIHISPATGRVTVYRV